MSYEWLILGAIVVVSILPMIKWLRRLFWAFTVAFVVVMLIIEYGVIGVMERRAVRWRATT